MTTMSSPVRSQDPENPGASHSRCRCLDCCLVFSLVLLTMVVGSLCVLYMAWERPHLEYSAIAIRQGAQQRNIAQLVIHNVTPKNTTVEWSDNHVGSTFVGKDFSHEKEEIVVRKSGLYYIYSQMVLNFVGEDLCKEDRSVTLSVLKNNEEDKPVLKLNIQINESSMKNPLSSFSASIKYLHDGDRIKAQLQVSHITKDWQFGQENSFLGLFWISDFPSDQIDK
ncbi:tumor necrosis factor ligand superfamily member 9 [Mixophyes fleayi]|uniref:tumor necrosis factor ligand superfamily member 9 n=1 Tax=Mixophyes fleayi TaxID=3061075 RepID=UPI003F4E2736